MATVSSVISSVKSWVSNNLSKYLPLGGGKMTGTITYSHTGLSIGTNPSATQYKAIHWTDNTGDTGNNHRLATVEYSCNASGTAGLTIGPYQYTENRGSYTGSLLLMSIQSNGTKSITWDGKPVVCVTRWSNDTSWYRKYSDGWIEQGGRFYLGGLYKDTSNIITFPLTFSNVNYTLSTQGNRTDNVSNSINNQCFVNYRSTSTFRARCYGDGNTEYVDWYASGT